LEHDDKTENGKLQNENVKWKMKKVGDRSKQSDMQLISCCNGTLHTGRWPN